MKNEIIYKYVPLWGSWQVEKLIGEGSIGTVYLVSKKILESKQYSAVKVITIPTKEQYNSFVSSFGNYTREDQEIYFKDYVKEIISEIDLLYKLQGHTNIINYYDSLIEKEENDNIWHIFIRMEYAESYLDFINNNRDFNEIEVVKMAYDISNALVICHRNNILHRDIKEANLFRTNMGTYKLGDFSIARNISELTRANTCVGTLNYIAPEVIKNEKYDIRVDIYSLGLVLYKMMNNGRFPFMPKHPIKITLNDIEQSNFLRTKGEKINEPDNGSEELKNIVLKAIEFNPDDRYSSAIEMRDCIKNIFEKKFNFDEYDSTNVTSNLESVNYDHLNDTKLISNTEKLSNNFTEKISEEEKRDKNNIIQNYNFGVKQKIVGILLILVVCLAMLIIKWLPNKKEDIINTSNKSKTIIATQTLNSIESDLSKTDESPKPTESLQTSQTTSTPTSTVAESTVTSVRTNSPTALTSKVSTNNKTETQTQIPKTNGSTTSDQSNADLIEDIQVHSVSPYAQSYNTSPICIGYGSVTQVNRVFFRLTQLPSIPSGAVITSAYVYYYLSESETNSIVIDVYDVNSNWDNNTIKWTNMPGLGSRLSSTTVVGNVGTGFSWNITSAVSKWYQGKANYGIVFKNSDETRVFNSFYSSESSTVNKRPKVVINYQY